MDDKYDYIYNATDTELSEMIDELSKHEVTDKRVKLEEAARRLRIRRHIPFNDEAFNC